MQKNSVKMKILSILLIVSVLLTLIPSPALAAISATKNNSLEQNHEILEILKGIVGDDAKAQEILEMLMSLGLLDESGEFRSVQVNVDGEYLTLDDIRELVNSDDADLDKVVNVDGTYLTLGHLKVMIEIEDELQRLYETYFSEDITLSEEHKKAIDSIEAQLEGEGIPLVSSMPLGDVHVPSGIDHTIRAMVDTSTLNCNNGSGSQSATIKLVDSNGNVLSKVPDYDISIRYRFVDGSAKKDTNYKETSGFSGTVKFTANSTQTQKNITFDIINDVSRFSGQKAFLIQFYDPSNIVLLDNNNGTEKDNMLSAEKVILINKNYTWPTIDRSFKVGNNFRLIKYSVNRSLWATSRDSYVIPDDMLDIIKNYGIYNTVELGVTVHENLVQISLFATIGDDGGNLFNDDFKPDGYYNYDILRLDTDGSAKAGVTYKKTFRPESFDLRKLEKTGSFSLHQGGSLYLAQNSPPYEVDYYSDRYIRFYDTVAPTVKSVTIPTSGVTYQYGQSIPVNVEFSEPVNMTNVQMNVNDRTLAPLESGSTGTSKATFLYEVNQREEFDDLTITDITGAVDLSEIEQEVYSGTAFNDVMGGLSKFYSFTTSTNATIQLDDNRNTVVTAFLPISDNELTRWIDHEVVYDETTGEMMLTTVYASIDGGTTKIPVFGVEGSDGALSGLQCTFTADLNLSDTDVTRAVEFFYADDGTTFKNMVGKYATYTVPPVVFLEADDIKISDDFPEDGVVFLQEGAASFNLTYNLKKSATWNKPEDFEWASSNTHVATIDKNGVIVLSGQPTGETPVFFTLTAKNGDMEGKAVTVSSTPLTVKVGLTPFLSIPEGTNQISVRSGDNAEVRWTSNLITKNAENGKNTEFTIEVFLADYMDGLLNKGPSIHVQTVTGNEIDPVSSYTIPASVLNGISLIGRYSYIVEVSAVHPYKAGESLKASAYISINSKPALVKLKSLDSYFITDNTESLNINWSLENFDTINGSEFEMEITDNAKGTVIHRQTNTQDSGGSHILSLPKVENGFRDVYTITTKAKNTLDSTWSYDSFVLYVYSDDALKIWIDGYDAGEAHTMSNREWISKLSSEEILALNREIYLKNVLSINYGDHTWGQLKDQIKWNSSDSSVASINFKDINIYNNIEDLSYISYRPTDTFILTGLRDGIARITATHAATNKTVSVDVEVDTLKDKLYLFQISPKAKTTLIYTNGNGEERTVETNDNGELALYEESGIQSEIHMKSSYGGSEYVGTLYNTVSSEKDYTMLELYPVNYFRLREISTAELFFIKPFVFPLRGGVPLYSGDVILRGGVYKNGEYCADAKLNDLPGTQDQIITIGENGKFTVKMDPTQFWVHSSDEELNANDELEFIFEVRFPDDEYYPYLLSINCNVGYEDAIKFGDKAIRLKKVPDENKYKPFIVTQYVDYGFKSNVLLNVLNFSGNIGLGQTTEQTELITTVFWWGEDINSDNEKHMLTLKDKHDIIPEGQTSSSLIYPFSTIKATRNNFIMNRDTMKDWLEPGERRAMSLILTQADGSPYKDEPLRFSIVNMVEVESAENSPEINDWYGDLSDFLEVNPTGLDVADDLIESGLKYLWKVGLDNEDTSGIFAVSLAPTVDPTVFSVLAHLNIGNMSNDNATGVYAEDDISYDLDYTPGLMDSIAMLKGNYLEKSKKTYKENSSKAVHRSGSVSYTLGGYIEGELRYNDDKKKWEFSTTGGGFNAGGGYSYSWNYNTFVGPVPVTAQFTLGGTAEVIFKSVVLEGDKAWKLYKEDSVKHYLTTLRLYAYIRAFAGLGFDYSIAAIKIGLFGQISVDAQFAFLNRPQIQSKPDAGQKLSMDGKVGIEVVLKFLFVSHEHVLASTDFNLMNKTYKQWDSIHKLWEDITKKNEDTSDKAKLMLSAPMTEDTPSNPVSSSTIIERRDYLEKFERTWNDPVSKRGLLMATGVTKDEVSHLETNSYPYSNPVLTDDGQIMLYVSDADSTDVEKTEVRWTKLTAGGYPNGTAIETVPGGYGDSQVKLAGNQSFAAAAWVRQSKSIHKEAGDPVTNADIALMSNSTEIMAAMYNGTDWEVFQLTDNATPDLAPAVATNGSNVMVAWRSVYAADSTNPLDFSGSDTIKYRIYNKSTGKWSEIQTLYNGTSGAVRGLEASMLEDGASAVVYTIAANDVELTGSDMSPLETVYAVISPDGNVVKNVRQTKDAYLDENPQITTVRFEDGKERFVLGWYSEHDTDGVKVNDIRLSAFDNAGILHDGFIDSINSVNANATVKISRNFRFVNNANTIDELSILWTETENAYVTEDKKVVPDRDLLKAVKFRSDKGFIYITAPLKVAEMDDYTLIDHFGVYNAGLNTVKAVLLGTNYGSGYREVTIEVEDGSGTSTRTILVPIAVSNLYTATGTYKNKIGVDYVAVDYTSIIRGMRIPVQFSVYNGGVDIINSITLKIGDNTAVYDEEFSLLPNDSRILTVYYDVPEDRLVNPSYTITAEFESAGSEIVTDTLYLDIPDIGVSSLVSLSNDNGKRVMEVTLYNGSDSILDGSGRQVKIGFYSDEACTVPVTQISGQEAGSVFTVDEEDLSLIDAGAYTHQFYFDIGAYVGEGKEIPDGGVRLYAKAWIEEKVDPSDAASEMDTIVEYNEANNIRTILFESLLDLYHAPVTLSTEQTREAGETEAKVIVKNNSLVNTATGNLIVSLLDESGNVLDSQQSYDTHAANQGLITLGGEQTAVRVFRFNQEGASVAVSYSNAVLTRKDNANLAALSLKGIPLVLDTGKTDYTVSVKDMTQTFISATTEDPDAEVTVNGVSSELGNIPFNLSYGRNEINIEVTAADGVTVKDYTITVINTRTLFSGNTYLATLILNDQAIALEDTKTEYAVEVKDLNNAYISATTQDPEATITINGLPLESGSMSVPLDVGLNTITIRVTGADGVLARDIYLKITNTKTKSDTSTDNSKDTDSTTAYHNISDDVIARLIKDAGKGNRVLIKPYYTGHEKRFVFSLSTHGMSGIADSGAALELSTPILNLVFDSAAAADIASRGFSKIDITIEIVDGKLSVTILADGQRLGNVKGHIIASLNVGNAGSGTVAEMIKEDGTTSLVKLSNVSNGMLTVPLNGSSVFRVVDNTRDFSDIQNHWAARYIHFVAARNLFQGTGGNRFSPSIGMTRGMIVTVLGRLSDIVPDDYKGRSFNDVAPNAFYAKYVEWAASNGIIRGNGQGGFLPDQNVTREQLAVILYNYIKYLGLDLIEQNSGDHSFADENNISDFAREAVEALYRAGVINGRSGNLFDPKGTATRAEVAAMLERLIAGISW